VSFALFAATAACGSAASVVPATPAANGAAAPATSAQEPEDCAGGPSAASLDRERLRALFGDASSSVLTAPSKVEAFRMRLDPGEREFSPASAERIAGYLIDGRSKPVSSDSAKAFAELALDSATYDFAPRHRCNLGPLFGLRFTRDTQTVELAFELRGDRVYIATNDEPSRGRAWSARFTPARAKVLAALRAAFEGDRDLK
jgi:hypothetical protein